MRLFNKKDISPGVNIGLSRDAGGCAVVFLPSSGRVFVNVFVEHEIFSPFF